MHLSMQSFIIYYRISGEMNKNFELYVFISMYIKRNEGLKG